jgi:hypothetical protein
MKNKKTDISSRRILYPSVEKIFIELLGEKWYENENLEEIQLEKAKQYKLFCKKNKRAPKNIAKCRSRDGKKNATKKELDEFYLATWLSNMKQSKKGNSTMVLYSSVEKILVGFLGVNWHEKSK